MLFRSNLLLGVTAVDASLEKDNRKVPFSLPPEMLALVLLVRPVRKTSSTLCGRGLFWITFPVTSRTVCPVMGGPKLYPYVSQLICNCPLGPVTKSVVPNPEPYTFWKSAVL